MKAFFVSFSAWKEYHRKILSHTLHEIVDRNANLVITHTLRLSDKGSFGVVTHTSRYSLVALNTCTKVCTYSASSSPKSRLAGSEWELFEYRSRSAHTSFSNACICLITPSTATCSNCDPIQQLKHVC